MGKTSLGGLKSYKHILTVLIFHVPLTCVSLWDYMAVIGQCSLLNSYIKH